MKIFDERFLRRIKSRNATAHGRTLSKPLQTKLDVGGDHRLVSVPSLLVGRKALKWLESEEKRSTYKCVGILKRINSFIL